jgi:ATP-GRASP peptide maturase of grasp-with-spasm system
MKKDYILICSDETEGTTDIVCDWLNYFNKSFIRISYFDKIKILSTKLINGEVDIKFQIKNQVLFLSQIKSYWYRRSKLGFEEIEFIEEKSEFDLMMNIILPKEYENIKQFFKKRLNEKAKLNKEEDNNLVKIDVLFWAQKLGLNTPNTLITNNKFDLKFFEGSKIISKAIGDIIFETSDKGYGMMTSKIEIDKIENDVFFPTLFQNLIEKKFEIRSFYLEGKFYSSAIFSQNSNKTKIDFRHYDREKPNRVVTYKLPEDIEDKLKKLMDKLDLKSGSIDLAYTNEGEYVFFEVNPVGQFEQVSMPCNYYLLKKVAAIL